jgi:uncharacterized repeat protein (TIGR01451 family)
LRASRSSFSGALAVIGLLVLALWAPARAVADPGVPAEPTVLFHENFEQGSGVTLLPDYVSATPGVRYTADPYWLNTHRCNGFILSDSQPFPGNMCNNSTTSWNEVRAKAYALGLLNTPQNPTTNRAVSSNTTGAADTSNPFEPDGPLTPNEIQFASVDNLTRPDASGRFVTFAVNTAATACGTNPPLLAFFLRDALGVEHPVSTAPINPCTSPGSREVVVDGTVVRYGHFAANSSLLLDGDSVGIVLRNERAHSNGNDGAFDDIQVLDVTPSLYKAFVPVATHAGGVSTLTYTITNTSELSAKNGWAFHDQLPAGLTVASPAGTSTTCPGGQVTATAGGSSISVTGNLATGEASCLVRVDVTSPVPASFTNGPSNITTHGLVEPPPASVDFGPAADVSIVKHASVDSVHVG